ncbi:MAG: LysE family transporter [Lewinellaceae bacterium]|nr:LysE family transporter [Lewinellaceae bacterium]
MQVSYAVVFGVTLLTSFAATIPFGPINLSVIETTVNRNLRAGCYFAIAAALVEILQSFIALHVSPQTLVPLLDHYVVRFFVVAFFLILGFSFLLKKDGLQVQREKKKSGKRDFVRGLTVALLNPQTIAFWIIVLAYFKSIKLVEISGNTASGLISVFILAACLGKLLALLLFVLLSQMVISKVQFINRFLNKIIGILLIALGIFQGVRAVIFTVNPTLN